MLQRRLVEHAGIDLTAQVARPELRIGLLHASDGVGDRLGLFAVHAGDLLQHALERRLAERSSLG